MWVIFKIAFVALGYHFGGPHWAVAGFIFGHALDAGCSYRWHKFRTQRFYQHLRKAQQNETFFHCFFPLLGKFAACDGAPTTQEIDAVEKLTSSVFRLNRKQRNFARSLFLQGTQSIHSFSYYMTQLHDMFHQQPQAIENIFRSLLHVAVSDGNLSLEETRLIKLAGTLCNFDQETLRNLCRACGVILSPTQRRTSASDGGTSAAPDPFSTLGCSSSDTVEEIKKRYRQLATEYHPDKIVAKDLPEDFIKFAQARFQEIQSAYQTVKRLKNFA